MGLDRLRIGTLLLLGFGTVALLVALLVGVVWLGMGQAEDAYRTAVASVSGLFISGSNELGEFESGVVSRFIGPVGAAVFGGFGTLAVTGLWAWMFPALRKADRLDGGDIVEETTKPHSAVAPAS